MKSLRLVYEPIETPIGCLYAIFSGKSLAGISLKKPSLIKHSTIPDFFKKELRDYFKEALMDFSVEVLFLKGTEFERGVWLSLKEIPYGETRTYKWLAEKVGKPSSSRAVGQALSRNPIPIVLPCHRIIESGGRIGGYRLGGADVKIRLLDMEYYFSNRGIIDLPALKP